MTHPLRSRPTALALASLLSLALSCDDTPEETVDTAEQAVTCRSVELSVSRSPGSAWTTDEETLSPAMTVLANNAGPGSESASAMVSALASAS